MCMTSFGDKIVVFGKLVALCFFFARYIMFSSLMWLCVEVEKGARGKAACGA